MTTYRGGFDPVEMLAREIERLQARVARLEQPRGLFIPFVDADLDPGQGNIWAFEDGRVRIRKPSGSVVQVSTTTGTPTSGTPKPSGSPAPKTITKTWNRTWSHAYRSDGSRRDDTSRLYYGNGDSYNGKQTSLVGFPYATIQSDLSGSTIKKVELYLYNAYSWWNSGSTIFFGMHNETAEPTTLPTLVRSNVSNASFSRNQGKWVTVSTEFGTRLRAGTIKGIALMAPNNDRQYYGYVSVTDTSPIVRITYVK